MCFIIINIDEHMHGLAKCGFVPYRMLSRRVLSYTNSCYVYMWMKCVGEKRIHWMRFINQHISTVYTNMNFSVKKNKLLTKPIVESALTTVKHVGNSRTQVPWMSKLILRCNNDIILVVCGRFLWYCIFCLHRRTTAQH